MYAVIEQGGKQYKVCEGDKINIELMDVKPDARKIELDKVLFVGGDKKPKIGNPYVKNAKVIGKFESTAEEATIKGKKLYPLHFRRRKDSKRKIGHRQKFLQVTIEKIEV
ncbi:MAG: 50S ribosomal protein L21 [Planctomycetota bacterium]|jgi:large subunit ribosomal protein L21